MFTDTYIENERIDDKEQKLMVLADIFFWKAKRESIINNCCKLWEADDMKRKELTRLKVHYENQKTTDSEEYGEIIACINDLQDYDLRRYYNIEEAIVKLIVSNLRKINLDTLRNYLDKIIYDIRWLKKFVKRYDKDHDYIVADLEKLDELNKQFVFL